MNYKNYKRKIATALATGAIVLNALAPAAFASDTTISGNGAFSDNSVDVSNNNNTTVSQDNNANVSNHVDSNASTGGNDASFNTGGNTSINTGDASTSTTVTNDLNKNVANVSGGNNNGGSNVTVSGNGAYSDNKADVSNHSDVSVNQDNNAWVNNDVNSNASSGGNNAKYNTGGDTTINTGNASTDTAVSTDANKNVANVSGNNGSNGSSVQISGNGAFSDNKVDVGNGSSTIVRQDNNAHVSNNVRSNAKTGGNDANFNTGGDTTIKTGDASTRTGVSTSVNFNAADVTGDFAGPTNVKVAGNGAESNNKVHANSSNDHLVFQDNNADVFNNVDSHSKTGENAAKFNTGHVKGDPTIRTGNAGDANFVHNSGNVNAVGTGANLKLSDKLGVNFDFDLNDLFNALSFNK